jgi:hypothetical protein
MSSLLHSLVALPPINHCIGVCVSSRTGLDDVEEGKLLTLLTLELRPLGRPARSPSLYRLRYPGFRLHYGLFQMKPHIELTPLYLTAVSPSALFFLYLSLHLFLLILLLLVWLSLSSSSFQDLWLYSFLLFNVFSIPTQFDFVTSVRKIIWWRCWWWLLWRHNFDSGWNRTLGCGYSVIRWGHFIP